MSLNSGRSLLAIPGPSVIPESVLNAMHRPSPNIYEGELVDITASLFPDLRTVAQTKDSDVAIYISNGHGAWEAALANTLCSGDKILVLSTGRFAQGWGDVATSMGIEVVTIEFGMQSDIDCARLNQELSGDKNNEYKAILCVQTDTASSVKNDIAAIRKTIDACGHEALFMVDCIASLGCDPFYMDDWGVDVMVAACQKGLMTPAGVAFVYFRAKAHEARKRATPSYYWDWVARTNPQMYYQQFAGTAPTHHIYALREALNILVHNEGMAKVWSRHETIAKAYWAAIDAWGSTGGFAHNIRDERKRSFAVSTIKTAPHQAKALRKWCQDETGVTLGIGLGFGELDSVEWNSHFRIGHMGHNNIGMVMGVIGAIDTTLKALDIPHGMGALEAAAHTLTKV